MSIALGLNVVNLVVVEYVEEYGLLFKMRLSKEKNARDWTKKPKNAKF